MTSDQKTENFDPQDLDWLAFCYVADELDSAKRADFEARLDEDQVARDAVARAVSEASLIHLAIGTSRHASVAEEKSTYTVSRGPVTPDVPFWKRPALLMTAATALVFFALIWTFNTDAPSAPTTVDLAEVWGSESWESDLSVVDADELRELVADEFDSPEFDMTEATWLVAAVDATNEPVDSMDSIEPEFPENDEGGMPCFH
ncbi:MAG: hypothetical protein AAFN77_09525 [Planctomycetota bacterium]